MYLHMFVSTSLFSLSLQKLLLQDEFSVFLLRRDGSLISSQEGVFRTNCVDCLDRTNVVQSMLARRSLNGVLHKLDVLKPGQNVQDIPHFESLFKAVFI